MSYMHISRRLRTHPKKKLPFHPQRDHHHRCSAVRRIGKLILSCCSCCCCCSEHRRRRARTAPKPVKNRVTEFLHRSSLCRRRRSRPRPVDDRPSLVDFPLYEANALHTYLCPSNTNRTIPHHVHDHLVYFCLPSLSTSYMFFSYRHFASLSYTR